MRLKLTRVSFALLAQWYDFLGARVVRLLAFGFAIGLVLFLVEVALSFILQGFLVALRIADSNTVQVPAWVPVSDLAEILLLVIALGSLRGALQGVQVYLQGASFEWFRYEQRRRLLRWSFFTQSPNSAIVTALFNENSNAGATVMGAVLAFVIQATVSILLGLKLFLEASLPTVLAITILAILGFAVRPLDRMISRAGDGLALETRRVTGRLMMSIKNLLFLQIYGLQAKEEREAQVNLRAFVEHILLYNRIAAIKFAVPQIAGIFLVCALALISRSQVVFSAEGRPVITVAYFYLFVRFVQNFSEAFKSASMIRLHRAQMGELKRWWQNDGKDGVSPPIGPDETKHAKGGAAIEWELSNVSFSYPVSNQAIFRDLNLSVKPGEMTLIIGASGAGKSTLMHLLLGKLQPSAGVVRCSVTRDVLFSRVGYVGPESFLIDGTVLENLCYGLSQSRRAQLSLNDFRKCLQLSECGFILERESGLELRISEQGEGLSAGQKQRLSLARALLREPEVLFLDEATANLDEETELRLVATLARLKGQLTIVAVSHRSALLAHADQCIRLER